jgi:hypothetical protein
LVRRVHKLLSIEFREVLPRGQTVSRERRLGKVDRGSQRGLEIWQVIQIRDEDRLLSRGGGSEDRTTAIEAFGGGTAASAGLLALNQE